MSTHSDWKAYRHAEGSERMCFAVSEASEQTPAATQGREKAHVYVTAWPKAGVKAEVSFYMGFKVRPGSEVKVTVGEASFTLFPDGDRAYVGDPNEELKLLEAMRRGSKMTIAAVSSESKAASDTYSLSGVTASIQAIASGCN